MIINFHDSGLLLTPIRETGSTFNCALCPSHRYLVVLPSDVPARREADECHLRAAGVLHRDLLLRRLRRPPHQDEQVGFVNATIGPCKKNLMKPWKQANATLCITVGVSPCDILSPYDYFWPGSEVVTISDTYSTHINGFDRVWYGGMEE